MDQSTNDPVKLKAGGTGPMAHPPNLSWHEQTNVFLPPTASIVVFSRYADTHTYTEGEREVWKPFFFSALKNTRENSGKTRSRKNVCGQIFSNSCLLYIYVYLWGNKYLISLCYLHKILVEINWFVWHFNDVIAMGEFGTCAYG